MQDIVCVLLEVQTLPVKYKTKAVQFDYKDVKAATKSPPEVGK